jgi:hypothetical protein
MSQTFERLQTEIFRRKPYLQNYFPKEKWGKPELQLIPILPKESDPSAPESPEAKPEKLQYYVSLGKTALGSSFSPQKQAERIWESAGVGPRDLVVILGLGNPNLVTLANEALPENRILIAADHESGMVPLLWENYLMDFAKVPGRHIFCGWDFLNLLWNYLDALSVERLTGIRFLKNPSSLNLDREFYNLVEERIRSFFSTKMSDLLTKFEFETLWIGNILSNTARFPLLSNASKISELENILNHIPTVLVSAGPSLREDSKILPSIRDKVFIMSCDTSLKVLLKQGIVPDAVYTLDAQLNSIFHFLGEDLGEIPVFADMVSSPYLIDNLNTSGIVFSMTAKFVNEANGELRREVTAGGEFADEILGNLGDIQSGGSVATTAFDALRFLGAKEIYFLGQDLAYTGREIHSTGTHHNEKWLTLVHRKTSLEKINEAVVRKRDTRMVDSIEEGKLVLTDYVLDLYRSWFEDSARSLEDFQLVNLGKRGAKIAGMKNIHPESVLETFKKKKNHNYPWRNLLPWNLGKQLSAKKTTLSDESKKDSDQIRFRIWGEIQEGILLTEEWKKREDYSSAIESWFSARPYLRRVFRKSEVYVSRHSDKLGEAKKRELLTGTIEKEMKRLRRRFYPIMESCFLPGRNRVSS